MCLGPEKVSLLLGDGRKAISFNMVQRRRVLAGVESNRDSMPCGRLILSSSISGKNRLVGDAERVVPRPSNLRGDKTAEVAVRRGKSRKRDGRKKSYIASRRSGTRQADGWFLAEFEIPRRRGVLVDDACGRDERKSLRGHIAPFRSDGAARQCDNDIGQPGEWWTLGKLCVSFRSRHHTVTYLLEILVSFLWSRVWP